MSRYANYDDLIRDLDAEGMSDDPFGEGFDDEDLAILGAIAPDKPRAKPVRKPTKPPVKKPAKREAKKL